MAVGPGATALTVMPRPRSSRASTSVIASTAMAHALTRWSYPSSPAPDPAHLPSVK